MKKMMLSALAALFIALMVACQSGPISTISETPADHPHRLPNTKVVGDYHISFSLDHDKGEVAIVITDASERPVKIRADYITARLTEDKGKVHNIRLIPLPPRSPKLFVTRRGTTLGPFSSVYRYQAQWLTLVHSFLLEVKVPIKGTLYEASFRFDVSAQEHQHHHHYK